MQRSSRDSRQPRPGKTILLLSLVILTFFVIAMAIQINRVSNESFSDYTSEDYSDDSFNDRLVPDHDDPSAGSGYDDPVETDISVEDVRLALGDDFRFDQEAEDSSAGLMTRTATHVDKKSKAVTDVALIGPEEALYAASMSASWSGDLTVDSHPGDHIVRFMGAFDERAATWMTEAVDALLYKRGEEWEALVTGGYRYKLRYDVEEDEQTLTVTVMRR